jgi:hypothetical protein
MAPEQVRNESVGPWTDIYALGLVMAEMLSGRPVVQGKALVDVFMAQASVEPVALPPEVVQGPLGAIVQRATQKSAAARYTSAGEMLTDLERSGAGTPSLWSSPSHAPTLPAAVPGSAPVHTPNTPNLVTALPVPPARRSMLWLPMLIVGFLLLGVLGVLGVGGALYFRASASTDSASAPAPAAAVSLQGLGAETVGKRVAPLGWKVQGEPILNLEGTHQMHIVTIQRGAEYGVVTIYDYLDASGAETEGKRLEGQGLAVARDKDLMLTVEVRGNAAEAKKLLEAITRA